MNIPTIYYLSETQDAALRGWLPVEINGIGQRDLCYGTKVEIVEREEESEMVRILDGPFRDQTAKSPLKNMFKTKKTSYFKEIISPKEESAMLSFNTQKNMLKIKGLGSFKAKIDNCVAIKGTYFLEIPSHPHKKTPRSYLDENMGGSIFAETWFRIVSPRSNNSESFLHYGQHSNGCLAVVQENSWNKIYRRLIRARKGRLNIGILTIY